MARSPSKDPLVSLRARVAVSFMHAAHDPYVTSQPARDAMRKKFEDAADPEGVLALEERLALAQELRSRYFTELQQKSTEAKRAKKAARAAQAEAAAAND